MLVDPNGSVWVILLLYSLILAILYRTIKTNPRGLLVGIPAFACAWVVTSYFVPRSHENNALNILPQYLLATIVAYTGVNFDKIGTSSERLTAKLLIVSFLVFGFTMTVGNRFHFPRYFHSLLKTPNPSEIDIRIPQFSKELSALMERAHVETSDNLVLADMGLLERKRVYPLVITDPNKIASNPKLWLPIAPEVLFCALSPNRQKLYIKRNLAQKKVGGWLLTKKVPNRDLCLPSSGLIKQFYKVVEMHQSNQWFLERYEPIHFLNHE